MSQSTMLSGTMMAVWLCRPVESFWLNLIQPASSPAWERRYKESKNLFAEDSPPIRMTPPRGSSTIAAPRIPTGRSGPALQREAPSSRISTDDNKFVSTPPATIMLNSGRLFMFFLILAQLWLFLAYFRDGPEAQGWSQDFRTNVFDIEDLPVPL